MIPLAGYADRLSARPGETLRFHVSNATGAALAPARVVRVISADANPAAGGIRTVPVEAQVEAIGACGERAVDRGSYAVAPLGEAFGRLGSFTALATIRPTRVAGRARPVLAAFSPGQAGGFALAVSKDGRLSGSIAAPGGPVDLATDRELAEGAWARVWLSWDAATATMKVGQQPLARGRPHGPPVVVRSNAAACAPSPGPEMLIAASQADGRRDRFNGRIERPMLFDRALGIEEIARAAGGELLPGLLACWDFGQDIAGSRIVDIGPHGCSGRLVNMPTRAVTGAAWTGREMCWRHAPHEYAAIHFHDDDIVDCGWPATHAWAIPADMPSGSYALILSAGGAEENIPFFVVPPMGKPRARIAVLMSTFTYVIYQNNARVDWAAPSWQQAWHARTQAWGGYPHNPGDHPEYGWSTYNYHTDGTGICLASWQRPMLNVRIGYITYPHPETRGSGLRHYPADHHLLSWLEAKGYAFDVITDWELHTEGYALLQHYPVLLTGSHPEYHTREMLDALQAYRDAGGRLAYLGGNGFYWKIALSKAQAGLIEIRRAEGGIRAWASDVGEYYNQLDGEYGGMWRRNGRPPQDLVGVGFTAQGIFVGSHYRVKEEARHDPRVAWLLDGIAEETIGGFGFSAHGAAGFELDRTDKRLGTPAHAVVVASSENHPPETPWVLVPEEHLTHTQTTTGEPAKDLIRADITFFETAGGQGAVFSVGSITFCGSLPYNGCNNNISRLLANMLDRFLDPAPFAAGERPA